MGRGLIDYEPAERDLGVERLKVSGNPSQYDDLGVFFHEQDVLRRLVAASRSPVLEVDMSDGDLGAASARIVDWLTATGGLRAPGEDAS